MSWTDSDYNVMTLYISIQHVLHCKHMTLRIASRLAGARGTNSERIFGGLQRAASSERSSAGRPARFGKVASGWG